MKSLTSILVALFVSFASFAQVGAISGPTNICVGTPATFSDATSGGAWTTSNAGIASIGSSTGIAMGVTSGVVTLTYSVGVSFATYPITVNPMPAAISGPSVMCSGTTGSFSDITTGGTWSVVNTDVSVGAGTGIGIGISVGVDTIRYTLSTGCATSTTVTVVASPTVYSVTGGGSYCAGGTGVVIGLSGSQTGVTYTLFNGGTIAATATGTGSSISFGLFTAAGTYIVVANYGTACATTMSGTMTVSINPLPTVFTVTGGTTCTGSLVVGLNGSVSGCTYQLFRGATLVSAVSGTGSALSFGTQTTTGTYTVVATNTSTGCVVNMSGSATIGASSTVYSVTGGGSYCAGGTGVAIGLSGSQSGASYQLYIGATTVGATVTGTGSAISFGLITAAGTYTVTANPGTGCSAAMSGSATVSINPLPTAFTITGGGSYCSSGSGVGIGLSGSQIGVNYQLYIGGSLIGSTVAGTGSAISFGLMTSAGTYTVTAVNTTTLCANVMSGSVTVTVVSTPAVYAVTGGGSYCSGGTGVAIGLSNSQIGVSYQLYNGATLVGTAVSGTGSAITFGSITGAATYTVTANPGTSCAAAMSGSATVTITISPTIFAITGGGAYCAGGTGVLIGLSGSQSGVTYQLYNGVTAVGAPVAGTGIVISFGPTTGAGIYTVTANAGTACSANMSGSATITANPLPTAFTVTGGISCSGSIVVGLSGSQSGVNYSLYHGAILVSTLPGTGSAISYGLQTVAGSYTVTAINATTGCTSNMTGGALVGTGSAPAIIAVTGGGSMCAGGTGVPVGLAASATGISYQLYLSSTAVGLQVMGIGSSLSFGPQTVAGTYTVIATNPSSGCSSTMSGSAIVSVYPSPSVYTVTGGGSFCAGGPGVAVGLSGSAVGVSYKLYCSTALVATMSGTGSAISFGLQTVTGTYTVVAMNTTTFCTANMSGSAIIAANPAPAAYTVIGGGGYCSGGPGVHINLSGSSTGVSYQLLRGGVAVGAPVAGTGSIIDFGLQTTAGTYTVVATIITTMCTANMTSSVTVAVNPLPTAFTVTGGGSYCSGGSGATIGLSGSQAGVNYQLRLAGIPVGGTVSGTGAAISFGVQTATGTYTVVATNISTTCASNMTGSVTISVSPLPTAYTVSGGGTYCSGSVNHILLSGSDAGVSYRLYVGSTAVGTSIPGTGAGLDFGVYTGIGTYTVVATNSTTGCIRTMTGSVTITTGTLPAVFTVTGGGSYCAGSTGVLVGLSGTTGLASYQLYLSGVPAGSPVAGTGAPISFGLQTSAGTYTVVATSTSSGCSRTMSGSAVISVNPVPGIYTVTGGGGYCSGGTGATIGLSGSASGISYRLYYGTAYITAVPGTGGAISFAPQTAAGTYTIVAYNTGTTCTSNMTGSATVSINPIPTISGSIYTLMPGHTITLAGSPGGGSWASSNLAAATIGSTSGVVTGVAIGSALISYTLSTGCRAIHTVAVTATGLRETPGVSPGIVSSASSEISVLPNPNKGSFMVKGTLGTTDDAEVTYVVMDMTGRVFYNSTTIAHNGTIEETIRLSNIAKGTYLLQVHTALANKVFHLVVEE